MTTKLDGSAKSNGVLEERVLEAHAYYLQMFDWEVSVRNKILMFGNLIAHANPVVWRIVGVTRDAVEVFAEHDFKKVSRMGVNRGPLVDRNETCTYLFTNRMSDPWEWWNYYYERDRTVLMTSSENMSGTHSETFDIPPDLFLSAGFAWRHRKAEQAFLQEIYRQLHPSHELAS